MKKFIYFVFLFAFNFSHSQTGIVEYKSIHWKDVSDREDFVIGAANEVERMKYSLTFDQKKSFFKHLPHIPTNNLHYSIAKAITRTDVSWHQFFQDKTSGFNRRVAGKRYFVKYDDLMSKWNLHNDVKQIANFTCYKATLNGYEEYSATPYTVEAWYTTDIPSSYGPIGYGGLPGLILELRYKDFIFVAQKVILNPSDKLLVIPEPILKNIIDEDKLVGLMRGARKVTED